MHPISASALAGKLGAPFQSLLIVIAVLIPVFSFGEDLIVSPVRERQNTRDVGVVLVRRGGENSFGFSSATQVSVAITPQTATVSAGGRLQFTATVTNTDKTAVTWFASRGSISSAGLFTAPSQPGTVVVTATDFNSRAQVLATVTVARPLTISTSALANVQIGTQYSASLAAQGGVQPYQWSLRSGSLPSGIKMTSTGAILGAATQSGTFTFAVKVTDTLSQSSTQQFTLVSTATTSSTPTPTPSGTPSSQDSGNFDGPAELPRVYISSAMVDTPAPGSTISVTTGTNLQSVLNNANCGDTIQLQAGATYSGNFKLPAKACDDQHWIIIRTSAPDSALAAEGTRMTPCYSGVASLPGRPSFNCVSTQRVTATLMAIKGGGPIILAAGANHYRLGPGLEITRPLGAGLNYGLIVPTNGAPADHIIIDRDWVHGTAQDETTRGLYLSGVTYVAVVDSYFTDFHCTAGIGSCVDAQTIAGGMGTLPQGTWKITNNFLEASAENILFGGGAGTTIPTDIEIRHNHLFKPLNWMPGQPGFIGGVNTDTTKCVRFNEPGYCPFIVKNLFELKNAQRVLFEGNILEYTWPGFSQEGTAVLLTAHSQGGMTGNPNATVADITFRYNHISHAAAGMAIAEVPQLATQLVLLPKEEARLSIHDDVFDDLSPTYYQDATAGPVGSAFEISYCPNCAMLHDILIDHVTVLLTSPRILMILGAPVGAPMQNVTFTNNIVSTQSGLIITGTSSVGCASSGTTNLTRIKSCFSPYQMTSNALIGASGTWPAGNFFPATALDVGFVSYNDANAGSYQLAGSSAYSIGTDGQPLGANMNVVDQETSGVQ